MTLSIEDAALFYKLWLPLLDYVNRKYKVNKKLRRMAEAKSLDPEEVKKVADRLWNNVDWLCPIILLLAERWRENLRMHI